MNPHTFCQRSSTTPPEAVGRGEEPDGGGPAQTARQNQGEKRCPGKQATVLNSKVLISLESKH